MNGIEWAMLVLALVMSTLTSGFIAGFVVLRTIAPTKEQEEDYNERLAEDLYLDKSGKFFTNQVIDR